MKEISKTMQSSKINIAAKTTKLPDRLSIITTECLDIKELHLFYVIIVKIGENTTSSTSHAKEWEDQAIGFKPLMDKMEECIEG